MTYKAYYVDDTRSEASRYINRLNAVGGFEVSYLAPPSDLSQGLGPSKAQLFLVDWEPSGHQNASRAGYHGGMLAQWLREEFEHTPIVLTSRNGKSKRWRRVNPYLFDAEVSPDEMIQQPESVVAKCVNLITGYQKLAQAPKTWAGLMEALGVESEDEQEQIAEATPPLLKQNGCTTWLVSEITPWVQEVLLAYPGILYDPLHAASYLGIDVAEFQKPDVQETMKDARYTGVLAPPEGRWWKDRLVSAALDVMVEAGMSGILLHRYFPEAFAQVHGRELARSACVYSKKKPAPRVCYVLKKPVRIEYSLVYQPDSRPTVMDDARVSFTAIRSSEEVFDEYFPPSSRHLVDEVRSRGENEL